MAKLPFTKPKHTGSITRKLGLAPGTVIYVGDHREDPTSIRIIEYTENDLRTNDSASIEDATRPLETGWVRWIDVCGVHDSSIVTRLGESLNIHPLALEDISNTRIRPKYEELENGILILVKMIFLTDDEDHQKEHVSVFFNENTVITFQERVGDVLDPVRKRVVQGVPRKRFMHTDYLAYSVIDGIVDGYFAVLESIGTRLEELETGLLTNPETVDTDEIYSLKRRLISVRKSVWPIRELVAGWLRSENKLVTKSTIAYLRDLYDHAVQLIDTIESFRDTAGGLLELYLASVSHRTNEVMRVLTIIATIFIPLSFLAGVYGMNFDTHVSVFNLPELEMKYGYIMFWAVALAMAGSLLWYFRKKRWL